MGNKCCSFLSGRKDQDAEQSPPSNQISAGDVPPGWEPGNPLLATTTQQHERMIELCSGARSPPLSTGPPVKTWTTSSPEGSNAQPLWPQFVGASIPGVMAGQPAVEVYATQSLGGPVQMFAAPVNSHMGAAAMPPPKLFQAVNELAAQQATQQAASDIAVRAAWGLGATPHGFVQPMPPMPSNPTKPDPPPPTTPPVASRKEEPKPIVEPPSAVAEQPNAVAEAPTAVAEPEIAPTTPEAEPSPPRTAQPAPSVGFVEEVSVVEPASYVDDCTPPGNNVATQEAVDSVTPALPRHSTPSAGALHVLQETAAELERMEGMVTNIEEEWRQGALTASEARSRLAQAEAQVRDLEASGVDAVNTSGLNSAKQQAKEMKKGHLQQLEALFERIEELFDELKTGNT